VDALEAIAKLDVILLAVLLLEGTVVFWLVPLGESPPNVGIWRWRTEESPDTETKALLEGTHRQSYKRWRSLMRSRIVGLSPDGIRRQRRGRVLLPIILLVVVLFGLFLFFGPRVDLSPGTLARAYVIVALTPFFMVWVAQGAVAVVRAWRQRRHRQTALRQIHERAQDIP
jgi:hypothetical protein